MATSARTAILFDLDGTLTDPFEGITGSIRYALDAMGHPAPPADELKWCIGPPLLDSFKVLLGQQDEKSANEALRLYRERYTGIGKLENRLIEGMPEVLKALSDEGFFLSVATSKLWTYSNDILEHFGLRRFFSAVHGAELDGRNSHKPELIAHILATEGLDAAGTVMIGDRMHDIAGARANGVAAIGVLWGYGDRAELEEAGAAAIASEPGQLVGIVRGMLGPGPTADAAPVGKAFGTRP